MTEIGLQIINRRALLDPAFAIMLRNNPWRAMEGYAVSREEVKALTLLLDNGWLLPGENGPTPLDFESDGCLALISRLLFGAT